MDVAALEALARRAFHPEQPHFASALAAVAGISDCGAAWRELAARGVIPQGFIENDRRRFVMTAEFVQAALARGAPPILEDDRTPPTLRMALTLAADPTGVLAAESATEVLYSHLKPWGAREVTRFRWLGVEDFALRDVSLGVAFNAVLDAVAVSLEEHGVDWDTLLPLSPPDVSYPYLKSIKGYLGWGLAVREGLEVSGASWPLRTVLGRPFAELPNPFEPLLALWKTGYVLLTENEEEGIVKLIARQVPIQA
ncbi:hypothetical protein COCOR_02846 [Corallococcus coralloides DSM 2259]|uniref:Uncharacterized protein n=1 Tax=Corallococcus coralloides (strain ATCC 25202 / DSM 2259 / NBRC 100086 / M2) TaxID=1144275 RepID=H8MX54_CORCM|nr:hypothetical protein [Corallococcus coralloides]AFE04863.1 hypothetical protein COCOR_02846 [Corallococcus coralloides DSM 2259]